MSTGTWIADLHEDIAHYIAEHGYREFSEDLEGRHGDIPKYLRGGVKLVFSAVFPAAATWDPAAEERMREMYGARPRGRVYSFRGSYRLAIERIKIYWRLVEAHRDSLFLVERDEDVELLGGSRIGLLISLEGADPLESPDDLEVFYRLGVRSLALTWNYDNRYASSCLSSRDYGLTGSGEELVEEANRLGVILDISHAGKKASLEAISLSRLPVIASHSNYWRVNPHRRNLDDDVLEALSSNGGIVGFTLITSTIGGDTDLASLVRHVIAVWETYGADILAIGSDYFGIERTPKGLEDASKLPGLLEALREAGLKDSDIEKIAHGNAMRVIREHSSRWK